MKKYGVLPDGTFRAKTYEEIVTDIQDGIRAEAGDGVQVEPPSLLGFLIRVTALPISQLWSVLRVLHDNFRPEVVRGQLQDALYSYWGLRRQPAVRSRVTLTFTGPGDTVIPANTIVTDAGVQIAFRTDEELVLPAGATTSAEVTATADVIGPIAAAPEVLVRIENDIPDVTVTNLEAAILGRLVETDEQFRARWRIGRAVLGRYTIAAIESQAYQFVTGLLSAKVISNRLPWPDSEGRPGHSFELIVWPETVDPDEVARVVAVNVMDGSNTFGSSEALVRQADTAGVDKDLVVQWSFAESIGVDVRITGLELRDGYDVEEVQDAITQRLTRLITGTDADGIIIPGVATGEPVRIFRVTSAVGCTEGVETVAAVEIKRSSEPNSAYGVVDLPMELREKAVCFDDELQDQLGIVVFA